MVKIKNNNNFTDKDQNRNDSRKHRRIKNEINISI